MFTPASQVAEQPLGAHPEVVPKPGRDLPRPIAHLTRIAPVARLLLGHGAGGESPRVRREPTAKGGVPAGAHAPHQLSDAAHRRYVALDRRAVQRPAREEIRLPMPEFGSMAGHERTRGPVPAARVKRATDDNHIKPAKFVHVTGWPYVHGEALRT